MAYRVIQWATGNVGRAAIEGIVEPIRSSSSPGRGCTPRRKTGRTSARSAGIGATGSSATRDVDALLALDADCVVYSPILADTAEVVRILESGKNVVTPLGWFYPFRSAGVAEVDGRCSPGAA